MDTTYYRFETRKVKVSGGADLLTIVPAPVAAPAGEVLDFDRCRRRLETKSAWQGLAKAAAEVSFPAAGADEDTAYEAAAPAEKAPEGVSTESRPLSGKKGHRSAPARKPSPSAKLHSAVQTVRTSRAGSWLELCASVAMILVCVCAGWAFLALV